VERSEVPDRAVAEAELAALAASRAVLADRVAQPWWHHVLLGVLLFVLIAGQGLDHTAAGLAVLVVFFAGNHWLTSTQRRRAGAEVDGGRPGASRRAYLTWLAIGLPVYFAALVAEEALDLRGALLAAGLGLGVGVALLSWWYSRRYVAGLRGEL